LATTNGITWTPELVPLAIRSCRESFLALATSTSLCGPLVSCVVSIERRPSKLPRPRATIQPAEPAWKSGSTWALYEVTRTPPEPGAMLAFGCHNPETLGGAAEQ